MGRFGRRRYLDLQKPKQTGPRLNERITAPRVRLIGPQGEQMGVVPLEDALAAAKEYKLDLAEVAPGADPPVCKILDWGKEKFREEKQRRLSRRKETSNKLRLIRFRPNIGDHDVQVKVRKLRELLEQGEKCRVAVLFRRREMRHQEQGVKVLDRVAEMISDIARIEGRVDRLVGREMGMVAIPLRQPDKSKKSAGAPSGRQRKGGRKAARTGSDGASAAAPNTDESSPSTETSSSTAN
ncbi:MAG: translation initiation factor IF-3 [Planctomycetota bacterium]|nr:MAG: translation initiation factor IF-3 [Planctomycetota bacterium]